MQPHAALHTFVVQTFKTTVARTQDATCLLALAMDLLFM